MRPCSWRWSSSLERRSHDELAQRRPEHGRLLEKVAGTQDRRIQASHQNGIHCTLRRSSFSSQRCRWNSWFALPPPPLAPLVSSPSRWRYLPVLISAQLRLMYFAARSVRMRVVSVVAHECFQVFKIARLCVWPTKAYACANLLLPQFGKFMHEAFWVLVIAQVTAHRQCVAGSATPQRVRTRPTCSLKPLSRRDAQDASFGGLALWTPRVCLCMSAGKPSSG